MGLQRVGHDWATELNGIELRSLILVGYPFPTDLCYWLHHSLCSIAVALCCEGTVPLWPPCRSTHRCTASLSTLWCSRKWSWTWEELCRGHLTLFSSSAQEASSRVAPPLWFWDVRLSAPAPQHVAATLTGVPARGNALGWLEEQACCLFLWVSFFPVHGTRMENSTFGYSPFSFFLFQVAARVSNKLSECKNDS